jgi:hypothetical protein
MTERGVNLAVAVAPVPAGVPESAWRRLPDHPRLFADAARVRSVNGQKDPVTRQIVALLREDAERKLAARDLSYPATGFLFGAVRNVQGRILTLALTYRLTGERRYFERARHELLRLADLPEWRPSHFLDVGEAALAAGVGLDWLYADLTPPERDRVVGSIVRNALLPSLDVPEGKGGWVDGELNWNQVCHGGLTVGALAVAEREPELARRIVARALKNLPYAAAVYAPDGTYPEGPSYWSYGTTFHVMLIEALRSCFGTSYGLEGAPGFLKTADFLAQMVGPTGRDYDFSDYHRREPSEPVLLWFARERLRRGAAREELDNLARLAADPPKAVSGGHLSRHLALGLLWWEPRLLRASPGAEVPLPLCWVAGGRLPMAVLRSAWDDPDAVYLALKGGTPNQSHGHMDVGSFILEADGVRWALDLGTESYDRMRAAKLDLWSYAQDSSRWTTFRVGPEGHNILRFDGGRQNVAGRAEVRPLPPEKGTGGGAVVDLTPLYRGQVERVRRSVRLNTDRSVEIEDEWTAGGHPVEASWQWLTRAGVTRTPEGGLMLREAGRTLRLIPRGSESLRVEVEDVSRPRGPQDSPNPGLSRIVIRLRTDARTTTKLSMRAIPGGVAPQT